MRQISEQLITALQLVYLFCVFIVFTVIGAAIDISPGVIYVRQVAGALLPFQLSKDGRLSLWERRHLF